MKRRGEDPFGSLARWDIRGGAVWSLRISGICYFIDRAFVRSDAKRAIIRIRSEWALRSKKKKTRFISGYFVIRMYHARSKMSKFSQQAGNLIRIIFVVFFIFFYLFYFFIFFVYKRNVDQRYRCQRCVTCRCITPLSPEVAHNIKASYISSAIFAILYVNRAYFKRKIKTSFGFFCILDFFLLSGVLSNNL